MVEIDAWHDGRGYHPIGAGSPKRRLFPLRLRLNGLRTSPGKIRTLRDDVATVRPRPQKEAHLHTETLPGEQAQVDWAHVGKISIHGTERALWLLVLMLAHLRAMWAEFVIDLSVYCLCRSLVRAADALGGVTRQFLFDNPKIVVLGRQGDAVQFHPVLLDLCGRLRVQPRLCAVGGKGDGTERQLSRDVYAGGTMLMRARVHGTRAVYHFVLTAHDSSIASVQRPLDAAQMCLWPVQRGANEV